MMNFIMLSFNEVGNSCNISCIFCIWIGFAYIV